MTAKERLDRLFSAYAILNDGRCVTCGIINETLQGGHYFGRTRQSTRWNFKNCFCQCASCNAIHENNTEPLRRVAIKRLGEDGLTDLERISGMAYVQPDYEAERITMREAVKSLPRWKALPPGMKVACLNGTYSNTKLIRAIHGC